MTTRMALLAAFVTALFGHGGFAFATIPREANAARQLTDDASTPSGNAAFWAAACAGIAITFQLLRMSIDLIQTAAQATSKDYQESHHASSAVGGTSKSAKNAKSAGSSSKGPLTSNASIISADTKSYGSIATGDDESKREQPGADSERASLLESAQQLEGSGSALASQRQQIRQSTMCSLAVQACLTILFWFQAVVGDSVSSLTVSVLPKVLVLAATVTGSFSVWLTFRNFPHQARFGMFARTLNILAALSLYAPTAFIYYSHRHATATGDEIMYTTISMYTLCIVLEAFLVPQHQADGPSRPAPLPKKKSLPRAAILTLLKPYFWPDESSTGGIPGQSQPQPGTASPTANRIRAVLTWVCVLMSKVCNVIAPILLGKASTALAHQDYGGCISYSIGYAILGLLGSTFREGQSLIYLKVAQAAFVQLSQTTFWHLHSLSLDWHLQKKLGEVIRSMDRGIAACDTLMKYLFLWLVPAMFECIVVCVIFSAYFQYLPLAISMFYFVWAYVLWTILITLWRKKFRKAVVQSDNAWHDRCTDSLVNFETVKYFTAEEHEARLFGEAVSKYQAGSVNVQASLSFLNISQKIILQICLATALSLSAMGIRQRIDCCMASGCDSGVSECCQNLSMDECPGMQVGDFVAVLTYTVQLFAPLNFLGSVYNAIVMALIDLTNLSELLAESPDVTDAPGALPLPYESSIDANDGEDDIAVEFDNVVFRYPTQSPDKGLKGISFKMKRGTTTAIVGPTGAGKTTISRLFFRFYDVLGGCIKVNGNDIRTYTQKSLRGAIGVVPQAASMFNDSVYTNLLYGRRDATHEEIVQAAQDAQLLDFIESLPEGWETVVGDRGLKLSGGEKQRAAIARCLLKDPPFVLLDEATSALDTLTERSVQEALDRLSGTGTIGEERTVLVIAHRLGTIRNADNIVVLKDGLIAEEGTHDELLEIPNGVYAEMWNMQLHADESRTSSRADLIPATTAADDDDKKKKEVKTQETVPSSAGSASAQPPSKKDDSVSADDGK